ncbi:MAG: Mth938-like domain-containing protein [Candidatus Thiodiazotropha sp. (ex Lucinoma aequizonata)]|nr:Mth938-like domain-containing protein [Candidatus Thiodiazotropha sp. (ex Lucinoma aequizonata)]MCU7887104.1 Mth938-like domain-containing protein [Candidatus Thiodiazotropha sp. (ex Lucinoma aequizonata)]MCU7896494.1 Mth938-like domain-containing protein [Candidatus Thiodiazotropha sp. (ex Lucinoma aequizonata)]MCU7898831.1 Mth938-like domain-containing protein [Candidatus Thiodiazotropha sp. (ex Lucinoma aequizonata)]MCU7902628.1 Mth938-like domain-containing protein [Candidatus Thiodiazot
MKFIPDDISTGHSIQGYEQGEITVSGTRYSQSFVVLPDQIFADWRPATFQDLLLEDFAFLANLAPEIVILGTGATQHFPHPGITQPLIDNRIGLEVMDTTAACRTYNILMSEGRRVTAGLFMI